MVALSESVMKNCLKHPLAEKSRWRNIRFEIKPPYLGSQTWKLKVTIEPNQEVMVALSETVIKNHLKHLLAEDWRWCHIRFKITPYLPNHASQIKSYYGTLSGSHGRSFRIRHKNRLKRPLAAKSRWLHIRLAIKPLISEIMHPG